MGMETQKLDEYAARLSARIEALRGDDGFRDFADALPGIVWTADKSGRTTFISKRWYEVFGTPDMDWLAIIHPDDHDVTVKAWMHSVATGHPYHHTARYRDAAGEWQILVTRAHLVRADNGSAVYWTGVSSVLDALAVKLLRAA